MVRVIGEDNAIGAQLVDQHSCTGRAGHLSNAAAIEALEAVELPALDV